jgi:fused signal recognition particle receptor
MFGFLKDKLSKAIKSISDKLVEKEEKKDQLDKLVHEKIEVAVDEMDKSPEIFKKSPEEWIESDIERQAETIIEEASKEIVPSEPSVLIGPEMRGEKADVEKTPRVSMSEPRLAPVESPSLKSPMSKGPGANTSHETKATRKKGETIGSESAMPIKESIMQIRETPIEPKRKSLISKLFERVTKTIIEKKLSESELIPVLEELETDLIEADVAMEVAEKIKNDLKKDLVGKEIRRGQEKEAIVSAFKQSIRGILDVPKVDLLSMANSKKPIVVLFLGFNGSGKTTSIAKTANWLKSKGYSCVFAAADSWRAAAIEQIEEHAGRIGFRVIKHDYGADPAAIVYDAIEHAKARGTDFVLADSAGRTHTNQNLMAELGKIVRVNKPDLKVLVIDSMTGNDAVLQAREFGNVGVDAVIFTKIDVNEKGGAILSVTNELKKPILFLGIGQEYGDFEPFDPEKFLDRIF